MSAPARTPRRHSLQRPTALKRFLYTREESARALGMSLSHFQRHVQPYLKCVYSGQLRLYRPEELKLWAEQEACEAPMTRASRALVEA
jgi:AraC-like DNA-binding protein